VLRGWLRVYHRLTVVGRQNLPVDRSFVLVANHASHLDTLCLLAALPLRRLHRAFPAAAKDYFCVSAPRALLAAVVVNALPFDRQFAPWQSLSVCAHLLEKPGNILILFPEGTRSGGPEAGEFKPGVALLAAGRDLPVVPCHLAGTHAALPKGAWCPRPAAVRLTIGRPRVYAHLPATRESARRICRELREAVVALGRGEAQPARGGERAGRAIIRRPFSNPEVS
jgi:1-acyl-sn-glycerol-3-phosphate acyltransferase